MVRPLKKNFFMFVFPNWLNSEGVEFSYSIVKRHIHNVQQLKHLKTEYIKNIIIQIKFLKHFKLYDKYYNLYKNSNTF